MNVYFNVLLACGGMLFIGGVLAGVDKRNGKWPWVAALAGAMLLVVDVVLLKTQS